MVHGQAAGCAPAPLFSTNGSSAAENVTVTLGEAGARKFTVKVTGPGGLAASSSVAVKLSPVLATLSITPNHIAIAPDVVQQFAAEGFDQFGRAIALPPGLTWTATAVAITSGRLIAPDLAANVTVTATDGSVQATATVTVGSTFLGISDPSLAYVTANLFARDGSIDREDMIQILQSIGGEGSVVTAAELSGLKTIYNDATHLGIPDYVQVLLGDVLDNNPADALYQGQSLGQLVAGSPTAVLEDLSSKWFLGTDLPTTGGFNYQTTAGTLFGAGPAYTDMYQGELGDCYFISSLGAIAKSNPTAIRDMFIDNGDNTWTVRFYDSNGMADYVTVNRMLPVRQLRQPGLLPITATPRRIPATCCGSRWRKRHTPSGTKRATRAETASTTTRPLPAVGWPTLTLRCSVLPHRSTLRRCKGTSRHSSTRSQQIRR